MADFGIGALDNFIDIMEILKKLRGTLFVENFLRLERSWNCSLKFIFFKIIPFLLHDFDVNF